MEHFELRLLADFLGGAIAPNAWARPTPLAVGGELEQDERGEIIYAEIQPPIGAALFDEDLRKVSIVLDGHDMGSYISLSGTRTSLMTPPKDRIFGSKLYCFGTPGSNEPLKNTTLKYKQNVTVACLAGPNVAGVTGAAQPYRVRLWGFVYKKDEIPAVFGRMRFPTVLTETTRGRSISLNKADPRDGQSGIAVDADSWLTLPGGKDQSIPKINPFARFAYNRLATDGLQGDYQFRFNQGGVLDEQENLYWEFDDKDALVIQGLGVTVNNDLLMPPIGVFPNLARTGLKIAGDYHPKGPTTRQSLFPTDGNINQLNYGRFPLNILTVFPLPPMDLYVAVPKLDRSYMVWNEIGMVVIQDDGVAAVPADPLGVTVAVTGIRIEMRG